MTGGTVGIGALALALCASTPAFGAHVVDPASARQAISTPAVTTRDAGLAALAAEGRATELASRLELIAHDETLSDVAQEWLLDRGLHALARIEPSPAARATVTRLSSRAPTVYTRADPDHGERATPLYDAGATARFVLRSWERHAARATAQRDLATRSTGAVARFAAVASDPVRTGIADAFRAAPAAEIAAQRPTVAASLAQGQRVDTLALIADEREALAALSAARRALDPGSAFETLARASRRADISSAAVLEAGRLAADDAAARRFLFEALADPGMAPSAAAALAALRDPGVSAEIGRRLASARTDGERRLLLLALRLDPSPAARTELERSARAGDGSPQLKAKTRRWLER